MTSQSSFTGGAAAQRPTVPIIVLLTAKEAAKLLKVSLSWLAKARMRGAAVRDRALLGDRMGLVVPSGGQELRHYELSAGISFGVHGMWRGPEMVESTGSASLPLPQTYRCSRILPHFFQ